jgi:hypothetical protein
LEITTDTLPWNSDDEARWNAFLLTDTGKRLLPKLAEKIPALLDGGEANRLLIRSGEVRGFQLAISSMLELTHSSPLPVNAVESYPPLDDDSHWTENKQ